MKVSFFTLLVVLFFASSIPSKISWAVDDSSTSADQAAQASDTDMGMDNDLVPEVDRAPAITTGYDTRGEISTDTQLLELHSEADVLVKAPDNM